MRTIVLLALLVLANCAPHYGHYPSAQEIAALEAAQEAHIAGFAQANQRVRAAVNAAGGCETPRPNNRSGSAAVGTVINGRISLKGQHSCVSVEGNQSTTITPPRVYIPDSYGYRRYPW